MNVIFDLIIHHDLCHQHCMAPEIWNYLSVLSFIVILNILSVISLTLCFTPWRKKTVIQIFFIIFRIFSVDLKKKNGNKNNS